jgi:hypothetical protein
MTPTVLSAAIASAEANHADSPTTRNLRALLATCPKGTP